MLKVQEIREIIRLIDKSTINEFTYKTNDATIILKKSESNVATNDVVQQVVATPEQSEQPVVASTTETLELQEKKETLEPNVKASEENKVDYDFEIVSPMVGTMYRSATPESGTYVEKGTTVTKDSIVCIVEAMKLFNEIEAEIDGEIVEVLVENGELVEYGQPLFRVKTN